MAEVETDGSGPPAAVDGAGFDAIAAMINSSAPEAFYAQAAAFDRAAQRLDDVLTRFRNVSRMLAHDWAGLSATSYAGTAQEVSASTAAVVNTMTTPGWGVQLRRAGDALAGAQQRIRELQVLRAEMAAAATPTAPVGAGVETQFVQAAGQILAGLSSSYRQAGTGMTPMTAAPETGVLQAVTGTSGQAPGGPVGAASTGLPVRGSTFADVRNLSSTGTGQGADGGSGSSPVDRPVEPGAGQPTGGTGHVVLSVPGSEASAHGSPVTGDVTVGAPGHGATLSGTPGVEGAQSAPFAPGGIGSAAVVGAVMSTASTTGVTQPPVPGAAPLATGLTGVPGVLGHTRVSTSVVPADGRMQTVGGHVYPVASVPEVLGRRAPATRRSVSGGGSSPATSTQATSTQAAAPYPETGVPRERPDTVIDVPSTDPGDSAVTGATFPQTTQVPATVSAQATASLPTSLAAVLPSGSPSAGSSVSGAPQVSEPRTPAGQDLARFAPAAATSSAPAASSVSLPSMAAGSSVPTGSNRPLGTDLSAVTGVSPTSPGAQAGGVPGRPGPTTDPAGGPPPMGHPMMPMTGAMGMGAPQERETDRQYDVAFESDASAWGAGGGAPAALGRPPRR